MLLTFEIGSTKTFQPGGLVVVVHLIGLTPADYFLWGYLKDIAYKNKLQNLFSLKQSIISAFSIINSDLCKKVCKSVLERL
jgi:hypothetical protein